MLACPKCFGKCVIAKINNKYRCTQCNSTFNKFELIEISPYKLDRNTYVRKLINFGRTSMIISIPIQFIRQHKLDNNDLLKIEIKDNTLICTPIKIK
jgi:transposase-like protein